MIRPDEIRSPAEVEDHPSRARAIGALAGLHWTAGLLLWTLLASLAVGSWSRLTWPDLVILPIGAAAGAAVARPPALVGGGGRRVHAVVRAALLTAVALGGVAVVVPREPTLAWGALLAGTVIPLVAGAVAVVTDRPGPVGRLAGAAAMGAATSLVLGVVWMTAGPGIGLATPPLRAFLVLAAMALVAAPSVAVRAARVLAPVRGSQPDPEIEPRVGGRLAWALAGGLMGLAWAVVLRLGMSGLVIVDGELTTFDWTLTTTAILLPAVVTGAGWGWASHARRSGSSTSPRRGALAALAFLLVPLVTVDGIVDMLASGEGVQLVLVPALLVIGGLAMGTRRRWPHLLVGALLGVGAVTLLGQGPGGWPLPSAGMVADTVALVGGFGIAFVAGAEPFRPGLVAPRLGSTLAPVSSPPAGA